MAGGVAGQAGQRPDPGPPEAAIPRELRRRIQPIGEGISELRIHCGPGYRVYYKQDGLALVLLLCGGNKDSQSRDIELAKALAKQLREFPE